MTVRDPTGILNPPALGAEGERCESCAGPLASDQRYCLECGQRRGPLEMPAGPFAPGPPAGAPPPTTSTGSSWWGGDRPPGRGIAAAAVLLFALGLGVLIGSLGDSSPKTQQVAAARPQVITVQTGGGGAPVAQFTSDWPDGTSGYTVQLQTLPKDGSDVAAVAAAKQSATGKGAQDVGALDSDQYASLDSGNYVIYAGVFTKRGRAAKALKGLKRDFRGAKVVKVGSGGAAVFSGKKKKSATVDRNQLNQLHNLSPDQYNKKSAKLPDTTKLPGKAPPKDHKKAGGGSGGGAIEIK